MATLTKIIIATLLSLCLFSCNLGKTPNTNFEKNHIITSESNNLNDYKTLEKVNKSDNLTKGVSKR